MTTTINRRFTPGSASFTAKTNEWPGCVPDTRWISEQGGIRSVLMYTDGAAPNNGQLGVRAGCGIILFPGHHLSFALERIPGKPITSNRAELRAPCVALKLRHWKGEGFKRVVIATDSEYVVRGISEYIFNWKQNGWRNSRGHPVANKDLWLMLLEYVEDYEKQGTQVQFCLIPREQNQAADLAARKGAEMPQNETQFRQIIHMPSILMDL
ncbi:ribonuclease H-like protein, partial [Gymnopus androsaceus JB14]